MKSIAGNHDGESSILPNLRQRPVASHSLLHFEQQMLAGDSCLEEGLRVEIAFELSQQLSNLFRAGLRSRGLQEQEIERLYNSTRR